MPSSPRHPRRTALIVAGLVLLLALAGGATFAVLGSEEGDVSNPDVEFRTGTSDEEGLPVPEEVSDTGGEDRGSSYSWPHYGLTKARTSHLPLEKPLRPPFKRSWKLGGKILLEFTPVLGARSLYLLKNNAALYALVRKTGEVRWKKKLGYLAASAPAYAYATIFATVLERGKGIKKGRVMALDAKDGRTRWSRKLPSRSESSPLVHRGTVYFGTEDGTVYALRARDGFVRWRYKAKGAVKSALSMSEGKLVFGDYAGNVQALRLRDGKLLWRTGTSGEALDRAGNFYSTPAIAFGRVYLGNTDGGVYSFSLDDGDLAWRKETGGFVYSTPAVANVRGLGPTVYIGSYDRNLYALDARSGRVRWSKGAGGRISGGVVILGDLVFYSTLEKETVAVTTTSGRRIWRFGRGAFNPVVSTGRGLFVTGQTSLFAFDARPDEAPERAAPPPTAAQRAAADRRAAARRAARAAAAADRRRARTVARRVAERRRAVRRRNALRRRGVRFCFRSDGRRVCRRPAPLVCFKRDGDGRTVCRPRAE